MPLVAAGVLLAGTAAASANVTLTQISSDPFTNSGAQHATEVEPDTYSSGSTIVEAQQTGRVFGGGSSDIGFATSTDSGATWIHGFLPGITVAGGGGGTFNAVSDAAVAFDPKHGVWMIASIPITSGGAVPNVIVSRSTNGGTSFGNPVIVTTSAAQGLDKDWIVCDTTSTSPHYGNCYAEWDDNANGNLIQMSTSTDGGLTWGPAMATGNRATGIGGQPVVQPNGTVVVPIDNANETSVLAFNSANGGASWSSTTTISNIRSHTDAGGLRSGPLPSAEIDGAGKVYVGWADCRFRRSCRENDIVFSTSTNGTTWSAVTRVPIDATSSTVDHFLPGLAVDKSTSGSTAHVGVSYYFYPATNCSASTCQLDVGYISSTTGGSSWSAATQLAGPMTLSWLPNTSQGRMVGDYFSTSFAGGLGRPAFEVAFAPSGSTFNQATYVPANGLIRAAPQMLVHAGGEPILATASDHAPSRVPLTAH